MRLVLVVAVLVALCAAGYLIMTGPRLKDQPHVRAYAAKMPLPPPGAVPVNGLDEAPSPDEAASMVNPLANTAENRTRGGVYFGYYCAACHGARGDGSGPVGESFLPPPGDLRSAKTQSKSDGQLLRAMLTGVGHSPTVQAANPPNVLLHIVPSEHRWYLVLYVRSLGVK